MKFIASHKRSIASASTFLVLASQFLTPFSLIVRDTYAAPGLTNSIQIIADGSAPFDATSYDPGTETNLGTDSSDANLIVRTGDYVDYQVQIAVADEGATNLTFSYTLPVGFTWDTGGESLPIPCLPSSTPASTLTNAGRTLFCNMGDSPSDGAGGNLPGTVAADLRVRVKNTVLNGTTLTIAGDIDSDQTASQAATPADTVTVTKVGGIPIPTVPNIDIMKKAILPDNIIRYADIVGSDGVTPGRLVPYIVEITNVTGAPGLDADMHIVLEDQFTLLSDAGTPTTTNAKLYTWGPYTGCDFNGVNGYISNTIPSSSDFHSYPNGAGGGMDGVANGQILNCTQAVPGGPVTIDIDHIDMSNTVNGPVFDMNGNPYASGSTHNTLGSYTLYYWVPLTDINAASASTIYATYRNTITGSGGAPFDPSSVGGVSNYGTGSEPTTNNIDTNTTHLSSAQNLIGSEDPIAVTGSYYWNAYLTSGVSLRQSTTSKWVGVANTYNYIRPWAVPDDKYGDRAVNPGETIGQSIRHSFPIQSGETKNVIVCEKINPMVINFTGTYPTDANIATNRTPLFENMTDPTVYTINPFNGATPTTAYSVTIEYSTAANTPNDRDATCGSGDGPWYPSLAAAGGASRVTKMRMSYSVSAQTSAASIEYRNMMGLHVLPGIASQTIPVWTSYSQDGGTTWNNHNSVTPLSTEASINPADPDYGFVNYVFTNWTDKDKISTADRIIVSDAFARVTKSTVPAGLTSTQVGSKVTFKITPTFVGTSGMSFTGTDYVVRDIMPPEMYYVFGSTSRPLDAGYPQMDGSGNTILQWTFYNAFPGQALPAITYKASTESTMSSVSGYPNTAIVSSPLDPSPASLRTSVYRMNFIQNSQYALFKRPIPPEVPVEDTLHYKIKYRNFSVFPNISYSVYIDAFPYVGDGTLGARSVAPSTFTGSYTLVSLSGSNNEVFEYTIRPQPQIKLDPCHVSNLPSGTTTATYCNLGLVGGTTGNGSTKWCSPGQFGTPGCPAALADATGFRMTLPNPLNPDGAHELDLILDSNNNLPGNLYTNTIGTRRNNFNLYTASNPATIHIYGASVGDRVWFDADSDGIQASGTGEYGLGGMKVTLERLIGSIVMDTKTTTTDANGNYLFENLLAGDYRITVTNNLGLTATYDLDGTGLPSLNTTSFALGGAENKRDVDFGYVATSASVGDYVWFDANADGIQDTSELGLSGVIVQLAGTTSTGASVNMSMQTDVAGKYLFSGLTGGNYTITVTPPVGTTQTYDLDGIGSAHSTTFTLGDTEVKMTIDFGYVSPLGSIGDMVWFENGSNTTFDGTDIALAEILVTLSGTDIFGNVVHLTTLTSDLGTYLFDALVAGTYTVSITTLGYDPYYDLDGTGSVNTAMTTLSAGQNRTDVDFSVKDAPPLGSFGDTVWLDANRDGIVSSGEGYLSGVVVSYSGTTWDAQSISGTVLTDGSGHYLFSSIPQGAYTVTLSGVVANLVPTYDLDGTGSVGTATFSLAGGEDKLTVDFGYYYPAGSLGDRVWYDIDHNATDTGELGFSGVVVTFSGTDFLGNAITGSTLTDSSGNYLFGNLLSGSYIVTVTPPIGGTETYDLDGIGSAHTAMTTLSAGQNRTDVDFGYYYTAGSIGDTVWYDTNQNGVIDPNEPYLAGVSVTLSGTTSTGSSISLMMLTNGSGQYIFTGIPTGNYSMTVIRPLGSVPTYDLDGSGSTDLVTFSFNASANKLDIDFGYIYPPGSIGDTVWLDLNNNGVQSGLGENGLAGFTVTLSGMTVFGKTATGSMITNTSGGYLFGNLLPGTYTVSVSGATLSQFVPTYDLDGTGSSHTATTTLSPAQNRTDVDFGYNLALMTVGDTVWYDADRNGIYVPSSLEYGLSGVTLTLSGTDILGRAYTLSTSTNASGTYIFSSIPAGNYTITIDTALIPPNYRSTYDQDGTMTSHTTNFSMIGGVNRSDVDFGYAILVSGGSAGPSSAPPATIQKSSITPPLSGNTKIPMIVKPEVKELPLGDGGSVNILSNDKLPGVKVSSKTVNVTILDSGSLTGVIYDPKTGKLIVPKNTKPGKYVVPYEVSEKGNQTNSGITTATIIIPLKKVVLYGEKDNHPKLEFVLPKELLDTGTALVKKGIKIIRNPKVNTDSMFISKNSGFSDISKAPRDLDFWRHRLKANLGKAFRDEEDGNADSYIVVPSLGIVTPITTILGSKSTTREVDFAKLVSGKEIKINPYLHDGVLHYPKSADIGKPGNSIYAGHSSYWTNGLGRYKTVFGNLIELDAGEEVWVYQKISDGTYQTYRYSVTASYNTKPTDVDILLPGDATSKITLFTCTPIGGLSGRWVIRGSLITE